MGCWPGRADGFALSRGEAGACRSLACAVAAARGFGSRRGCAGPGLGIRDKLLSCLRLLKNRSWVWLCRCHVKHSSLGAPRRGEGPRSSSPKVGGRWEMLGGVQQLSFGAAGRKTHFPSIAFVRCSLFFFCLAVSGSLCSLCHCWLRGERGTGGGCCVLGQAVGGKSSWSEDLQKMILGRNYSP